MKAKMYTVLALLLLLGACRNHADERPYENEPLNNGDENHSDLPGEGLMNGHHPDSIHMEQKTHDE